MTVITKTYNKTPEFGGCYDELLCPCCGHNYLHHDLNIENYVRKKEDDESSPRNPSGRRDGLIIWFFCEGCHQDSALTIAQHKGKTLVEWRITEEIPGGRYND